MESLERIGAYVAKGAGKWTIADEAARHDLKKGHGDSRSPFELLQLACYGDAGAAELWEEWEQAALGRRHMDATRYRSIHVIEDGRPVKKALLDALAISLNPGDAFLEEVHDVADVFEDEQGRQIVRVIDRGTEEVAGVKGRGFGRVAVYEATLLLEVTETASEKSLESDLQSAGDFLGIDVMVGAAWTEHVAAAPKRSHRQVATEDDEYGHEDEDDILERISVFTSGRKNG